MNLAKADTCLAPVVKAWIPNLNHPYTPEWKDVYCTNTANADTVYIFALNNPTYRVWYNYPKWATKLTSNSSTTPPSVPAVQPPVTNPVIVPPTEPTKPVIPISYRFDIIVPTPPTVNPTTLPIGWYLSPKKEAVDRTVTPQCLPILTTMQEVKYAASLGVSVSVLYPVRYRCP
jgi:hypothetical protein